MTHRRRPACAREDSRSCIANWEAIAIVALELVTCAGLAASARASEPVRQTGLIAIERRELSGTILQHRQYTLRPMATEARRNVPQVVETVQLSSRDETQLKAQDAPTASNATLGQTGAQPDQVKTEQSSPRWRQQQARFELNELTEVPGALLQPGTYVIRSKNAESQNLPGIDILEILSTDGTQVFATITSVPEYNPPPPGEPQFTYYERQGGHATIKSWWPSADPYPYEQQFTYPRVQALRLKSTTKERVLLLLSDTSANPTQPPEPTAHAIPKSKKVLGDGKRAVAATSQQIQSTTRQVTSAPLPKTGPVPLQAMTGLLFAGLVFRGLIFIGSGLMNKAISPLFANLDGHDLVLSRLSWKWTEPSAVKIQRERAEKQGKHYTAEEKVAILRRHLLEGTAVSALCDELGLQPTVFYRWQEEFFENGAAAFQANARADHQAELERNEFLEKKIPRKREVLANLMAEHIGLKKELGL